MMARAGATPTRRPPSVTAKPPPHAAAPALLLPRGLVAAGSQSQPRHRLALPPAPPPPRGRRACACSPTTHPGSFRCALHRGQPQGAPAPVARLGAARRPSMASPLVRIAAVEGGDAVRRALVRPSSQPPRRRDAFRLRPSRLSAMSSAAAAADDDDEEPSSWRRSQ